VRAWVALIRLNQARERSAVLSRRSSSVIDDFGRSCSNDEEPPVLRAAAAEEAAAGALAVDTQNELLVAWAGESRTVLEWCGMNSATFGQAVEAALEAWPRARHGSDLK
jgi:hypothetical protein